ncbi:MAG: fibrinogen-like YCDxxxxGGGW domain-containing protein, partial [Proteobacteria bacterium]|nr:fibrinogen-like YCDxxxxGGGW domain-containing protein [Pseudomonadota bacterium]
MGYWRLGDGSGTTAADSSLAGNTGTYNGTCTLKQTGAIQNNANFAAAFNGSTCYVSAPNGYAQASISIEAWFKTSAATAGGLATLSNVPSGWVSPMLTVNANGTVSFYTYGTVADTITSPEAYNNGAWHHVVATIGSAGMILYIDGTQVASSTANLSHWTAGTQYWTIGRGNGSTNHFNGTLDEVALYTTQLSAAKVQSHYQAGLQKGLTVNRHCLDILNNGNSIGNGIYTIYPNGGSTALSVYCNMSDQGGGWTLIGRGRYDWLWNESGMSTTTVHQNVG